MIGDESMSAKLNHTIVLVRNKQQSAEFLAEILGSEPPTPLYGFLAVNTGNDVSLDFCESDSSIAPQHYAFLVTEAEFDEIFGRIKARGLQFWAEHTREGEGAINRRDGGRGVYFEEPSGHFLEILTRPYGSGPKVSST